MNVFVRTNIEGLRPIKKAKDGTIVVEGIAASCDRDYDGDVIDKAFLRKMAQDLVGAPIFYNHNYMMPPIGKITETTLIDGGEKLFIRGVIDTENEDIKRSIEDGRLKYFSVGGRAHKMGKGVYFGKETRILLDGVAKEVSVTAVPVNPVAGFRVIKGILPKNHDEIYKSVLTNLMEMEEKMAKADKKQKVYSGGNFDRYMSHAFGSGRRDGGSGQILATEAVGAKRDPSDEVPMYESLGRLNLKQLQDKIKKAISRYDAGLITKRELAEALADDIAKANQVVASRIRGGAYPQMEGRADYPDLIPGGHMSRDVGFDVSSVRPPASEGDFRDAGVDRISDEYLYQRHVGRVVERGYDRPEILDEVYGRRNVEAMHYGRNPIDEEYLASFSRTGYPDVPKGRHVERPVIRDEQYYYGAVDEFVDKYSKEYPGAYAKSERWDPNEWMHKSTYLGLMGRGRGEHPLSYIHRLLHELDHFRRTNPSSPFIKAIKEEIVDMINSIDWEEIGTENDPAVKALFEHVSASSDHIKDFTSLYQKSIRALRKADDEDEDEDLFYDEDEVEEEADEMAEDEDMEEEEVEEEGEEEGEEEEGDVEERYEELKKYEILIYELGDDAMIEQYEKMSTAEKVKILEALRNQVGDRSEEELREIVAQAKRQSGKKEEGEEEENEEEVEKAIIRTMREEARQNAILAKSALARRLVNDSNPYQTNNQSVLGRALMDVILNGRKFGTV